MIVIISFFMLLIIYFYIWDLLDEKTDDFSNEKLGLVISQRYGRLGNNYIQLVNILKEGSNKDLKINIEKLYETDLVKIIDLKKLVKSFNKGKKNNLYEEDIFFNKLGLDEMKNITNKYIINFLRKDFNQSKKKGMLIHIRSGDIFNETLHNDYTQPPLKFYLIIINEYLKNGNIEDITILSEPRMTYDNPVIDELVRIYPGIILKRPDIIDSVKLILSYETVVSSNSTLVLTMLCLSKVIKKIIVSNYNNKFIEINSFEGVKIKKFLIKDYITKWEQNYENLKMMIDYDGEIISENNEENNEKKKEKNAIVVYTRDYKNNQDYDLLIKRNKSIEDFIVDSVDSFDNIIYHDGITSEQQSYIQSKTKIKLIFRKLFFRKNFKSSSNYCIETELSKSFSEGYKRMCHFWTIDFLEYLKDYNFIMRLDEDCELKNKILINSDNKSVYRTGMFQDFDLEDVTKGLLNFTSDFLEKNKKELKLDSNSKPKLDSKLIKCPYTNLFIMNVNYFYKNKIIMKFLKEIDKTDCIYINRWGDLPIYGIIFYLFVPKYLIKTDSSLKYYHESHQNMVN